MRNFGHDSSCIGNLSQHCTERRLAAYELDRVGTPACRIGHLPKDTPRQTGGYLVTLHRAEGKRRIEGKLITLKGYIDDRSW
jgi:hypothetical protein